MVFPRTRLGGIYEQRNLISSTIQWLNSALHSAYLVKKKNIGVKGTGCERQPHKLQQKASKRREYTTTAMFHVHGPRGRNFGWKKRQVKEGDYVVMFNIMAHEQRNIAQSQIHLPFTFRVRRAEGGRGGARRGWGGGAEKVQ
jgi:hypothetical protein